MENLKKELGFIDIFSLAAGAMISSGIFILPGLAFAEAGPGVIVSYVLAGILALVGVFSVAELATAMPKAGGDYYYVNRSMGPMFGTISGIFSWFALSLKSAFAVFGIAEVLYLLTDINITLLSVTVCIGFVVLNIVGVKEAARLEVALVVALLGLMVLYVVLGVRHVAVPNFDPFTPKGLNPVLATSGFVFVSFGGLLNVSSVAEEVKNPQRNLPLGLISAVLIVTTLYALLLMVTIGVLPGNQLKESLTPVADAARTFTGQPGYVVITIAAMLAFITTANAGIMSASRYPLALSRDQLLPDAISKVNKRFHTPVRSIVLTGFFIVISLFLPVEILVKAASTVVLTSYVLANLAVIILRESRLQNYRPSFKAPLYPWIQLISIVIFGFLIVDMGMATVEISLGLVFGAILLYVFYGRKRAKSEYAWLHLMGRIGNRQLESYDLESELRSIIHQRDDVESDSFDELVQQAAVLDLDTAMDREAFFERCAEELAECVSLPAKKVVALLNEREAEGTTVLVPEVAVPHIITYESGRFQILIARCREGIRFSDEAPAVKAIFVIMGSKTERSLHLQALAAIAQIIQDPGFDKRWKTARNKNHLRDVLLLSKRRRT